MRWVLALPVLALALGGCATPATPTPPALPTVKLTSTCTPTVTLLPSPTLTASPLPPTPTATATPGEAEVLGGTCPESQTACILARPFFFQRPVAAAATQLIDPTYRYGATQDGHRDPHHGVDFPNTEGTPVLAAGDGRVVVAGNDKLALYGWVTSFYGNLVVIEHPLPGIPRTVYTLYGHLSRVSVQAGQSVRAGDKIGEVGATGIAIGSHLHFEVRITNDDYKSTRNPEVWLAPLPGTGVLAGRVLDRQGTPVHVNITLERLAGGESFPIYPLETYPRESLNGDDILQENFATTDRLPGLYRLSLIYNGGFYEQQVKVEAGKLSMVIFRVK